MVSNFSRVILQCSQKYSNQSKKPFWSRSIKHRDRKGCVWLCKAEISLGCDDDDDDEKGPLICVREPKDSGTEPLAKCPFSSRP